MLQAPASPPQPETQAQWDAFKVGLQLRASVQARHLGRPAAKQLPGWVSLSAVQEVDLLLLQWDMACLKLEKAEADFERSKQQRRPTFRMRCCGCTGEGVPPQL